MDEEWGGPPEEEPTSQHDQPELPEELPLGDEPERPQEPAEEPHDEEHPTHADEPAEDEEEHHTLEELIEAAPDYSTLEETDYHALEEDVHSPEELRARRDRERAARRRLGRQRLLGLLLGVAAVVVVIVLITNGGGGKSPTSPGSPGASPLAATVTGAGYLAARSQASALPGNILVADKNNNRLIAVSPTGQIVWQRTIRAPSDAYLSRTGKSIVVTRHSSFDVLVIGVKSGKIDYTYGHAGRPGSGANRLHDPGSGQFLADGKLVIADKSNCRILFVTRPTHHKVTALGRPHHCRHDPPHTFAYPDSAFPTTDGGLVVSEYTPGWIDLLSPTDTLVKALAPAGLTHPIDANEFASGKFIASDYGHPGAVVEFDSTGKVLWTYGPSLGSDELFDPTLAQVLPDGNVLVCDSRNDRVIVIDSSTKQIIWQYGTTAKPGPAAGYLHTPDSAILVP